MPPWSVCPPFSLWATLHFCHCQVCQGSFYHLPVSLWWNMALLHHLLPDTSSACLARSSMKFLRSFLMLRLTFLLTSEYWYELQLSFLTLCCDSASPSPSLWFLSSSEYLDLRTAYAVIALPSQRILTRLLPCIFHALSPFFDGGLILPFLPSIVVRFPGSEGLQTLGTCWRWWVGICSLSCHPSASWCSIYSLFSACHCYSSSASNGICLQGLTQHRPLSLL